VPEEQAEEPPGEHRHALHREDPLQGPRPRVPRDVESALHLGCRAGRGQAQAERAEASQHRDEQPLAGEPLRLGAGRGAGGRRRPGQEQRGRREEYGEHEAVDGDEQGDLIPRHHISTVMTARIQSSRSP
jgi:hypothetical protein